MKNLSTLLITAFFITSCSIAPFSTNTSGRSYGAGKFQTEVGNVNSTYNIKLGMGLSENFDAGYVMEFGAISTSAIFFKHSFINNPVGPALAVDFGYGSADTSSFYYIGAIGSISFNESFELFLNPRVNFASVSSDDIDINEQVGTIKLTAEELTYLQFTYGMNLWFSQTTGLSLYAIYFKGDDIETNDGSTFGTTILFNF